MITIDERYLSDKAYEALIDCMLIEDIPYVEGTLWEVNAYQTVRESVVNSGLPDDLLKEYGSIIIGNIMKQIDTGELNDSSFCYAVNEAVDKTIREVQQAIEDGSVEDMCG